MQNITRRYLFAAVLAAAVAPVYAQKPVTHRLIAQDKGRVVVLNEKGEVEWEVACGFNSHDLSVLPNGNFLIHLGPAKIVEMTKDKQVVWEWQSKPVAPYTGRIEIHGYQRLKNGLTVLTFQSDSVARA